LFIAAISLLPGIAPWAPYTWISPMLFVLTFAILREGIEDYMRYKHDLTTNSQIIEKVVSEGEVKQIKSKEIKVGDMIKINEGEELPADIIMVQSSDQGTRST
jgi:P-type E1-E2 ATPase